jgi:hypothetical protein
MLLRKYELKLILIGPWLSLVERISIPPILSENKIGFAKISGVSHFPTQNDCSVATILLSITENII